MIIRISLICCANYQMSAWIGDSSPKSTHHEKKSNLDKRLFAAEKRKNFTIIWANSFSCHRQNKWFFLKHRKKLSFRFQITAILTNCNFGCQKKLIDGAKSCHKTAEKLLYNVCFCCSYDFTSLNKFQKYLMFDFNN